MRPNTKPNNNVEWEPVPTSSASVSHRMFPTLSDLGHPYAAIFLQISKLLPKNLEVWNNMPIFASQNPPRVENTEARPPLKRWAYFLKRHKQTRYG